MREVAVANVTVRLEAGEAGGRYMAPILILPGLFQSWMCWRGMTAMLAHRGWDVYLLPRMNDNRGVVQPNGAEGWDAAVATANAVATALGDKVVLFGADIGASIALTLRALRPLALVLFAPSEPAEIGRAFQKSLGFFSKRRLRGSLSKHRIGAGDQPIAAPQPLAKQAHRETDAVPEPRRLVQDLVAGVTVEPPADHPPAIVFAPDDDPLVARDRAEQLARSPYAKLARARVVGRFWPSSRWDPIADEAHRFLILTLADRVVEFPEEILES